MDDRSRTTCGPVPQSVAAPLSRGRVWCRRIPRLGLRPTEYGREARRIVRGAAVGSVVDLRREV